VTEVGLLQYAVKNEVRNKTSSHDREEWTTEKEERNLEVKFYKLITEGEEI
jgi:hypothetical protein